MRRIDTRELIRRQRCDRSRRIRRPLECRVVMNDHNPVARQPDVELETIGPERETVIERRNRILGPKRRPTAVRVNKRTQGNILVELLTS